jgi:hypothetical protein
MKSEPERERDDATAGGGGVGKSAEKNLERRRWNPNSRYEGNMEFHSRTNSINSAAKFRSRARVIF